MTERQQQHIFDSWVGDHQALLFKVILAYAFTQEDHEDLFQEITVQIWRSVPKFKEDCAISTWMYRIALNTALKWTRKERRHSDARRNSFDQVEHLLHEQQVFMDERLTWLYEQIAHLDKVDRSLTLLILDGFSYKEMADILGISENYVGVKINRIKKHLIEKSQQLQNHGI